MCTTYIRGVYGRRLSLPGADVVWNAAKASSNIAKHGVTFDQACQVFFDPFVRIEDADVGEERRDAAFGLTEDRTTLCVVHLLLEDEMVRVISARLATTQERRRYEDGE